MTQPASQPTRRTLKPLLAAGLLASLLITLLWLTACVSPTPAPTATPQPPTPMPATPTLAATTPTAAPRPDDIPAGVYAMMDWTRLAGADGGRAYPWIKAGHYAFTWRQVNPARSTFDWTLVDRWLEGEAGPKDAPTGKRVGLGINAYEGENGEAAPPWVLDAYSLAGYTVERKVTLASCEADKADLRPELRIELRSPSGSAQTLRLQQGRDGYQGCTDAWIEAANPKAGHAGDKTLTLGAAGQANLLLQFFLPKLPADAQIISATLLLYVTDAGDAGAPLPVAAYGLRRAWDPTGATWLSARPDQTWTIRGANGVLDEADREAKPAGQTTIAGGQVVSISLEPTLVQGWIERPASNLGLLVKQAPGELKLPRYWDAGYLAALREMLDAFGRRYGNDPRLAWVEISVGIYGETAPANKPALKWSYAEAGLTSSANDPDRGLFAWTDVVMKIIDLYRAALPRMPLFLQYSNYFESVSERGVYVPYAVEKGIGLKHNGLYPDSIDGATQGGPAVGAYNIMFTYSETVPVAWEFQVFPRTEGNVYWALLNALDKHADFVMVQRDAITRTELIPVFDFANRFLGAGLQTTPAIWVALRETERPAERYSTQHGNFSFYMTQSDAGPGGKTFPLWKVDNAKEGLFARRTDQATGNRYMYFDADDRYVQAGRAYTLEVVYLDRGRDTWHVDYDAGGQPKALPAVQKTDSGQWKRAVFQITDGRLAGGVEGFDFRIDCNGDGDEIVHMALLSAAR
jgi:hypothetical protein